MKLVNPGKKLTTEKLFVYVGAFTMILAAYLFYAPKFIKKPANAAPRAGSPESMSSQSVATSGAYAPFNSQIAVQQQQALASGKPYGIASPAPVLPGTPSGA